MDEGYLYCISNLDIMPGIYKIGMTLRDPIERLKEANSSETWKIPTFKIEFAKKVLGPKNKEKKLHKLIEKFTERVHQKREFFRGNIEDIREVFELLDGENWEEKNEEINISMEEKREDKNYVENELNDGMNIKNIIWSDENKQLTDIFGDTYSFGDNWKKDKYIKIIKKNGIIFSIKGGVHRGYCIWLDLT